jgi:hypothetical protein
MSEEAINKAVFLFNFRRSKRSILVNNYDWMRRVFFSMALFQGGYRKAITVTT